MKGKDMATQPTLEEIERFILDVYKQKNIRANECLPVQVLLSEFLERKKLREDDLPKGLNSLIQKGLLRKGNINFYCLTDKGFAAI
jgi:hypothetical protein